MDRTPKIAMFRKARTYACLALALSVFLLVASPLRADVIYSSLGPGNAYNPTDGICVGTGCGPFQSALAMSFTPAHSSSMYGVEVALSYVSGTPAATVSLDAGAGGFPAAVLASWNLTAFPSFGTCCTVETLLAAVPVRLDAGAQYWIVVTAGAPDTFLRWNRDVTGMSTPFDVNVGYGFLPDGSSDLAFAVQTPEPASLLLLGTGLVGLARMIRRKA